MKYTVLLVGAGQLGSRYLQGMVRAESHLDIIVVDPSSVALERAKSRWIEAGGEQCRHFISWANDIPLELKKIDLALVVTSAKGRAELVKQIASKMEVRYWVLEKVLAQSVDELEIISCTADQSHGAWVNTPRRMSVWHQSLKKAFESKGPIKAEYSADLWGLGCNSIHFLDLISWWMGEKLHSIDTKSLDSHWFESQRAGYFEVTGKLVAHFTKGSTLILEARHQAEIQPLVIGLADGTNFKIDEANGAAFSTNGDHIDGHIEFQSQLSGRLVDDILLRGQCDLPSLEESAAMHATFLNAMLKHWNVSQKRNDVCVPIT
jgi:predicted dehydrogenase